MESRKVALVVCATARGRIIYLLDSPQYNINRLHRSILGWVSHTTDRGAWSLSCGAGRLAYRLPPWPVALCGHSALAAGGTRIRPHPRHSVASLPPQAYGLLNVCWELYFLSISILPVSWPSHNIHAATVTVTGLLEDKSCTISDDLTDQIQVGLQIFGP